MTAFLSDGAADTLVRLTDLTLGYRRHPAVHHLSGGFRDGSLTAIVGPNGAGKSTLLKAVVGALPPFGGSVTLHGLEAADIAYLPQQAEVERDFPIDVLDTVLLGHWRRVGLFRRIGRALARQAEEALAVVGLSGFERRPIGALSAGQFQRVLFARMLLQDARLILLDEPFTAIDARTTADLLDVVRRWHGERRTVVAVLHDLDQVRAHFPDTLLLAREPVAWGRTADTLTAANLDRARSMAEAWDDRARPCRRTAP
ncbi:ABC transporter [Azospirillum thiophilum]|uniref:ABC transporter n=1 Tax=Azospirillum thiophilum TaxID=528244 RepID=A0AAC8W5J2_9PROT|nr:ABC transporter ATP-binding protein [Azospirillum thiophilum]ALG75374.1 ABC transporter [Azospirillum thiophilum]KJR62288.1 ABC transporter [Azospirillum thiophilum]